MDKKMKSQGWLEIHSVKSVIALFMAFLVYFSALPLTGITVHAADTDDDSVNSTAEMQTVSENGVMTTNAISYWVDDGNVATAFEGGIGTENDPYIIKTEAQLAYMAKVLAEDTSSEYVSDYFMVADGVTLLDMSAHEWIPITKFSGNFDGNGTTISGLTIKNVSLSYVGFFDELQAGAVVQNVNFANANIDLTYTESLYVGIIAGAASAATINNCKVVSGSINVVGAGPYNYVGGLIGYIRGADETMRMINCLNNSSVTATNKGGTVRVGGFIGFLQNTNVEILNCANTGDITGKNEISGKTLQVGGLVATASNTGFTTSVKNFYNSGIISVGEGSIGTIKVGSLIAGAKGHTLENCYWMSGIVNIPDGVTATTTTLGTEKPQTEVQSEDFAGLLNTNVSNLKLEEIYSDLDFAMWEIPSEGGAPVLKEIQYDDYEDENGDSKTLSGSGKMDDPYIISDAEDLALMSVAYNTVELTDDKYFKVKEGVSLIDLSDQEWIPISKFAGNFDGNGATISGLTIKNVSLSYVGFFDELQAGAVVQNVNFANANIDLTYTESLYVGIIAGAASAATINNCKVVSGSINVVGAGPYNYVGGLIGYIRGADETMRMINCLNNSSVTATNKGGTVRVGGFIGFLQNTNVEILNCANTGDITGKNEISGKTLQVGGLVATASNSGDYTTSVKNFYNSGMVCIEEGSVGTIKVGSLIAGAKGQDLENCYWMSGFVNIPDGVTATTTTLGTEKSAAEIKSAEFVNTLNKNASAMNAALDTDILNTWALQTLSDGEYPVPTDESAGIAYALEVTYNDLGSVKTQVKTPDSSEYSEYTTVSALAGGTSVRLECTPNNGYFIESITVNGKNIDLNNLANGIYDFTLTESTEIEVVFGGYTLEVSSNSALMGTVSTMVKLPNESEYVDYTSGELPSGTSVRLTCTPGNSCTVESITKNQENIELKELNNNLYEFIITGSTIVMVTFNAGELTSADIYVNPNAELEGNGSLEKPLRTLEEAKEKIAELVAATPHININVYLMGGKYVLAETLELGTTETSYDRVTFKNYNDESPVITGAVEIEQGGLKKVDGKEYYSYQLPESAKVQGKYPQFRNLLVNGELAILARTDTYLFEADAAATDNQDGTQTVQLYVADELTKDINNSNIGRLEIGYKYKWNSRVFHFTEIGTAEDGLTPLTVEYTSTVSSGISDAKEGNEYWLQNHISFLDEPGEFYYDEANGVIYYYPYTDQNIKTIVVEYPALETLIEIENAANITFDGIVFTGTTFNWLTNNGLASCQGCTYNSGLLNSRGQGDPGTNIPCAAILGNYADGVRIQNCTFTQLGGHAMLFNYGIDDLQIIGNSVTDIGLAGISIGVQQRRWCEDGLQGNSIDVTISNNYISNVGMAILNAPGIRVARSKNLEILHNTIIHAPYTAIAAGWGFVVRAEEDNDDDINKCLINAEIAYNHIEDYMYALNDGGAIYTNGANDFVSNSTEYFNSIHDNYIRPSAYNRTFTGIYHDGSASNWHTYHNLIDDLVSSKGPMFFQDDVVNQYTHNILVENNFTTASEITTSAAASRNIQLVNNVMVEDRSKLCEEALAIMANAGVESSYANVADPMNVALQIADSTVHYVVDRNTGETQVNVKLTNNSDGEKSYTLTMKDALPDGLQATYSNNGLTLAVGESGIVTITLTATDKDSLTTSLSSSVIGFEVEDNTGRTESYPRSITVETSAEGGSPVTPNQRPESEVPELVAGPTTIAYGTPVVDGIIDDIYKDSCKVDVGTIFYPSSGNPTSDLTGYCYLLWDQTYLYCYAVIDESTVMSLGSDILSQKNPNTLWKSDVLEFWLKTTIRDGRVLMTKFAVDAFGIQRYGDNGVSLEYHQSLPYATAFTYNGSIIENYTINNPGTGQLASTSQTQVNGYVIEMTLPLTEAVGVTNKSPWVGDEITIQIQNNDLQKMDGGTPYVVALHTEQTIYTLGGKAVNSVPDTEPEENPSQTPEEEPGQEPEEEPSQEPEEEPGQEPEGEPGQEPEEEPNQTPEEEPNQTPEEEPSQGLEGESSQTPEGDRSQESEEESSEDSRSDSEEATDDTNVPTEIEKVALTGDSRNLALWIMVLAAVGMMVCIWRLKRSKENEKL